MCPIFPSAQLYERMAICRSRRYESLNTPCLVNLCVTVFEAKETTGKATLGNGFCMGVSGTQVQTAEAEA
jgi:hypothetical protein